MNNSFKKRISRIKKQFDSEPKSSCLVISSSLGTIRSRDTHYEYRADSDLFYLTGSREKKITLLISSKEARPTILAPKPDKLLQVWEGAEISPGIIAKRIGANLVITDKLEAEIESRLKGIDVFYHQHIPKLAGWRVGEWLTALPGFSRVNYPRIIAHSDLILEKLRLFKDKEEINAIYRAIEVTSTIFQEILSYLSEAETEHELRATIDYLFDLHGATSAFNTIVACGRSAATLHYSKANRKLKRGELVLIDFGAELNMYASDITRVLPVNGRFSPIQRELYNIVLDAQASAISKIKHGVSLGTVHLAAASVLTHGLIDLKVLKGKHSRLLKAGAYKKYFMHGIGHSLGIDVHDVGNIRANNEAILEDGMVITIEPGLYFPSSIRNIPACGIRIEDDVLVKRRGRVVLSESCPKEISEIEGS